MKIIKVSEGAFFVPCYSEQTLASFQLGITNQTVILEGNMEDVEEVENVALEKDSPSLKEESEQK